MPKKKKLTKYASKFYENIVAKLIGGLVKVLWWIVKLPYYLIRGIIALFKGVRGGVKKAKVKQKRQKRIAHYETFKIIQTINGDFAKWEKHVQKSDSVIGIILGARGTGKTAFGIKLLENIYSQTKRKCFAMGFEAKEMPSWITVVENVDQIKNNAQVLIDEGGIFFSSRKSMSKINKMLSDLILVARHKNLSIAFISQNSANLDVNILRQVDYLVLKPSSLLQKDFERKKIKELYEKHMVAFEKYKGDKGTAYIHADSFQGFVSNSLPSFWTTEISKSFK
ncbi:hypothetical protein GOV09_00020 [Candidatus Woesearchaeota archaeon]|nr:hypothetical protein [Candidatus Woesearchaeota archaeon]